MMSWSTVHLRLLLFNILKESSIGISGSKLWCDLFTAEALAGQDQNLEYTDSLGFLGFFG